LEVSVSFTPRPLYLLENSPRYPLYRRLCGPQSRSGRRGEEKILDPTGTRTPTPRSSSPYPIAIPTEPSRLIWTLSLSLSLSLSIYIYIYIYISLSSLFNDAVSIQNIYFKMIGRWMNYKLRTKTEGRGSRIIQILTQHLPVGTEEKQENAQSC
jgi:hypothetical protein